MYQATEGRLPLLVWLPHAGVGICTTESLEGADLGGCEDLRFDVGFGERFAIVSNKRPTRM